MAAFEINKGVGRTVEFKGLKAQYLFLFAGGLLAVFILVVILYLCGISPYCPYFLFMVNVCHTTMVAPTTPMTRQAI